MAVNLDKKGLKVIRNGGVVGSIPIIGTTKSITYPVFNFWAVVLGYHGATM